MRRLLLSRAAQAAVVIALVATLAFVLIHVAPGDPFSASLDDPSVTADIRATQRAQWGYDRPLPQQYVRWIANLARLELGWSHTHARPVKEVLARRVPNTLLLMATALGLGLVAGVALGTWQAARQGSRSERASGALALLALSAPEFLVALGALGLFAVRWRLLPVSGMVDPVLHDGLSLAGRAADVLRHLLLPAGTLALLTTAAVSRFHRSAMLAVLPEEFVRTARAKGVTEVAVLVRHALRNALGPVITIAGLMLPALFGGAVFVEKIFGWPGMGLTMVNAVGGRDYPLVLASVLVGSVLVALGGAVAEVLAAVADPRVRGAA
ncbi:MAG TPA: ABC transporter permease [Gemmatimonadaceae bacterium]|nr:ABC transporter permease [Gemmatimonadaceae bacterium]